MTKVLQQTENQDEPMVLNFRFYASDSDSALMAQIAQESLQAANVDWIITAEDILNQNNHLDNFDAQEDIVLVENEEGPLAFALAFWYRELRGDLILRQLVRVLPQWRDYGIEQALFEWVEGHLLAKPIGEVEGEIYLSSSAVSTEEDRIEQLKTNGYTPARYFFEMVRPLDEPIPDRPLPVELEVRPTHPEHHRKIFAASDEAFQDHWGHVPLTENMIREWMDSPEFQPELWQVAWDGDQVAGMVLNYIRHDENERFNRLRGYTEDISVRRPWRQRGLATALLARSLKLLKQQGMQEAALGVDTENLSGALQLYERLGFRRVRTMVNYRRPVQK
jgi:ribosomal protein S18 acetylase RimI-like enzyme